MSSRALAAVPATCGLMERQRLSAGDAFDLLRRASQRMNRELADVAQ